MVKGTDNNAKWTLTDFLYNLVSIVDVVIVSNLKLLLFSIKAIISCLINLTPLSPSRECWLFAFPLLPLLNIEVIDILEFQDFFFLKIR